jgi:hypothetical protein
MAKPGSRMSFSTGLPAFRSSPACTAATLSNAVITRRGTHTKAEWWSAAEAFPVPFGGIADGLGSVHAGFYARYPRGTNGVVATQDRGLSTTPGERAPALLAAQVSSYITALKTRLPLYVTGHSLGAAHSMWLITSPIPSDAKC